MVLPLPDNTPHPDPMAELQRRKLYALAKKLKAQVEFERAHGCRDKASAYHSQYTRACMAIEGERVFRAVTEGPAALMLMMAVYDVYDGLMQFIEEDGSPALKDRLKDPIANMHTWYHTYRQFKEIQATTEGSDRVVMDVLVERWPYYRFCHPLVYDPGRNEDE